MELVDRRQTHQRQISAHLDLKQFEHSHHSRRATGGHRQAFQPADAHCVGTQRQRLEHVGAAQDATVEQHLGPAADRAHHLGQHVQRAAALVELTTAVVGDVDDVHAMADRQIGVFGAGDAFEDQRYAEAILDPLDQVPAQRGLQRGFARLARHEARAPRRQGQVAFEQIAFAAAVDLGVDGQAEGPVAGVLGAADDVHHPGLVAMGVELVDLRVGGFAGQRLEIRLADRTQDLEDAEFAGRKPGRQAAARIEHLQRADRREQHGDALVDPQQIASELNPRDIVHHAGLQGQAVEGQTVALERCFRVGAADQIVPVSARQFLARLFDHLLKSRKVAGHGRVPVSAFGSEPMRQMATRGSNRFDCAWLGRAAFRDGLMGRDVALSSTAAWAILGGLCSMPAACWPSAQPGIDQHDIARTVAHDPLVGQPAH